MSPSFNHGDKMTIVSNGGLYNAGTFIPFKCNVTGVTRGTSTIVTTDVNHGFITGNQVQFSIPKVWGMVQLNGLKGIVLSFTSNTITVNIDSTFFDPFVTPSVVLPVVIDSAEVLPIGDQNIGYSVVAGMSPSLQIPGTFRNTFP
jgi:hypothetical protein